MQIIRALTAGIMLAAVAAPSSALQITAVQAVPDPVPRASRLELTFDILGSAATNKQWPYDPAPPNGVPAGVGISVSAVFTDPTGQRFTQPAFYAERFRDEVRDGRDWHLPTGTFNWHVRFTPTRAGSWTYRIVATDRSGSVESPTVAFTVSDSAAKGFIRVSQADRRYFEFEDGSLFTGLGFQFGERLDDPVTKGGPDYATLAANNINFVRIWVSSIFGSAWGEWLGTRGQMRGYLPQMSLLPFDNNGTAQLTMRVDYEAAGDTDWFEACRYQGWNDPASIEPNTSYRVSITYRGVNITGPRNPSYANYGLVGKIHPFGQGGCYEPGTLTTVTAHGRSNSDYQVITGTWTSGPNQNFLPPLHLAMENVTEGIAYVSNISVKKELGGGALGPEILSHSNMSLETYIPEEKAYSFDRLIEQAEANGVALKVVVLELNDEIWLKMRDDGNWVFSGSDNTGGFYGTGRTVNKTRWLQQVWWRYLQARWGYSPSIHSWELTNEGDPSLVRHYEMADEFGKFMHCRVFGVEPGAGDRGACNHRHPNAHMVTTSFWQYYPATEFWGNAAYPNVDYADMHAYVSTSFAPLTERTRMQWDSTYLHTWHSQHVAGLPVGKPVVRGETGLDAVDDQSESVLGVRRDINGVWLHNLLWAGLDAGALYELYWWNTHIWDTNFDHRGEYRAVANYLRDIPLNRGGWVAWGGSTTNSALSVVGQKRPAGNGLILWVQNANYTWKNSVDGVAVAPQSGTIVVPGFAPGATISLEQWDTHTPGGRAIATQNVTVDGSGALRITVNSLQTDTAFKARPTGSVPPLQPSLLRIIH